jgi:lysozyme
MDATTRVASMLRSFGQWGRRVCAVFALLTVVSAVSQNAEARNLYPRKGDAKPHDGVDAARRHAVQGIDVSKYQHEIDWLEVKKAGTRFAFIKATEGGDHLDVNFRDNWDGAKEAGVPRGAYHFVFWCRPAKDQIRWFTKNVPKDPDALPPVLDVEWNHLSRCSRTSPEKARAKMREILRAFEAHYGKKPIIYTDITFHEDVLEGTKEFDDYPFWIRSVADKPSARYENREWEFWQFTATGRVPGIRGDVDRNAFYGTEKQFKDWVDGRLDIGSRRQLKPDVQIAAPLPPKAQDAPQKATEQSKQPLPPMRPTFVRKDWENSKTGSGPILPPMRGELPKFGNRNQEPLKLIPPGKLLDVTSSIKKQN